MRIDDGSRPNPQPGRARCIAVALVRDECPRRFCRVFPRAAPAWSPASVATTHVRSLAGARQLPEWLVWLFRHITNFGLSGWFLYPIGLLLLALAAVDTPALPQMSRKVLAAISVRLGFVFAAIAIPGLFVAIVKRLIGRARPFVAGEDAWSYKLVVWRSDYAAFPSGHATTAFAAAVAIGAVWPRARAAMWSYAVVIAVSRVIVTAHHPSDVIAGAIVGTIGALLVRNWYAARRLGKSMTGVSSSWPPCSTTT